MNDILRSEFNTYDSIPFADDSVIADISGFIHRGSGINRDDFMAYYYSDKGEWAKADSIRDYDNGIYEKQNQAKLIDVYKQLKQSGKNIYSLVSDTVLQQQIMQVVNDSTRQGYAAAISILQQVFGLVYYEPIMDDEGEDKRMIVVEQKEKKNHDSFIICYPNPSTDVISFKYNLPEDSNKGEIRIYNSIGQKIRSITLTAQSGIERSSFAYLPSGIYYYNLVVNNSTLLADKFVINK